jgi:hypothetical protein
MQAEMNERYLVMDTTGRIELRLRIIGHSGYVSLIVTFMITVGSSGSS